MAELLADGFDLRDGPRHGGVVLGGVACLALGNGGLTKTWNEQPPRTKKSEEYDRVDELPARPRLFAGGEEQEYRRTNDDQETRDQVEKIFKQKNPFAGE